MTSGWMRATSPSGSAAYEGEVQWAGELGYGVRAPEGGQSAHRDDEATGTKPLREVLEAHLLDEDIPLAHRGMQGRVWRAKEGAAANRKKMDATRARMKELRASRKAAKAEAKADKAEAKAEQAEAEADRADEAVTGAVATERHRGERLTHAPRRALLLAATRATWPDILVFAAAAAVILVGAIGVVTSRNPVHAALSLVMTLFGVAVLFIEQEADFLAAVQIIVYAGAIVVLFLFVIMFLGVDRAEDINVEPLVGQRPLAFVFSLITLARRPGHGGHGALGHRRQAGGRADPGPRRRPELAGGGAGPAGQAALHHLPVRLRGHGRAARHRRGRRRRAGPPPADGPRRARGQHRERAAGMSLSGAWYLGLAAIVFTIGAIGLLVRRNVLIMFMCIELMLNAANLTFVTFARMLNDIGGQAIVFFVLVVAAAEVVVGLGIVVTNFRRRETTVADDLDSLKG